jgi:rhomboid protease GluP
MKSGTSTEGNSKLLESLLYELTMQPDLETEISERADGIAVVRMPKSNARAVLLAYNETRGNAIYGYLRHIFRQGSQEELEVVLIGGPSSLQTLITKARPKLTRTKIRAYHFADDKSLWTANPGPFQDPPLLAALKRFSPDKRIPQKDWAAFEEKMTLDQESWQVESSQLQDFANRMRAREPIATKILLGIMVLFFVGELMVGGSTSTPTLIRMGALVPTRIWDGEWYRLVSCTFLHHGYMHLLFNGFVIWALGSSLERIIGSTRFLFTYGFAALGGSIASLHFMGGAFSVGASGALWGLLGAGAVLGFFPRGIIPASAVPAIRRTAIINLGLNLAYSMQPQIDIAAHFGGGITGAVLFLTGISTFGLPKLNPNDEKQQVHAAAHLPSWLRLTTFAVWGTFAAALAASLYQGAPWVLLQDHEQKIHVLKQAGYQVSLPTLLQQTKEASTENGSLEYQFGNMLTDPAMVSLSFSKREPGQALNDMQLQEEAEALRSSLVRQRQEGVAPLAHPKVKKVGDAYIVTASFEMDSGLLFLRRIRLGGHGSQVVDVMLWPEFQDRYNRLSEDILNALKATAPPGGAVNPPE